MEKELEPGIIGIQRALSILADKLVCVPVTDKLLIEFDHLYARLSP